MLFEILRAFEGLGTKVTLVRLERDVDANVRGDVVAFDRRGPALGPGTRQVEVVGALAPDVTLTDVILPPSVEPGNHYHHGKFDSRRALRRCRIGLRRRPTDR